MNNIGVVIPAYNEENDLPRVLNTVCSVDWITQVVVVNDGSTDNTLDVAQEYAAMDSRLMVEHLIENRGKGAAMLTGVQALADDIEIVIFLDADLIGLTPENLAKLCDPIRAGRYDMAVAVFSRGYWRTDVSQWVFPNLGGQRCLLRNVALAVLEPLADSGYGVEIGLTRYAKRHKWQVQYVDWRGTTHSMQEHNLGWKRGFKVRGVMYQQILKTWSRTTIYQLQKFPESHPWYEKIQRLWE
ncbi:MAG: glycosyltransferase family 2 protein [Anaerolineales bacterium]|nr:glycosyltransferase family 2 protein [Anaerolineales bacterium]